MNFLRLIGDLLHLLSILLLLRKINKTRSCSGISLKTIELYLIVFVTRYLDLFFSFVSLYNLLMKLFYISSTALLIHLIRNKYKASYDKEHDTFSIIYLIAPSAFLALVFNDEFSFVEVRFFFNFFYS